MAFIDLPNTTMHTNNISTHGATTMPLLLAYKPFKTNKLCNSHPSASIYVSQNIIFHQLYHKRPLTKHGVLHGFSKKAL